MIEKAKNVEKAKNIERQKLSERQKISNSKRYQKSNACCNRRWFIIKREEMFNLISYKL